MIKVGITGGIGSGKSMVCEVFKLFSIPIYHADLEAKKLYDNDKELLDSVVDAFGKGVLDPTGHIDKRALAAKVFNDQSALDTLNNLVHPLVSKHFDFWCAANKDAPYILKEAAILFESGAYLHVDKIITVTAPFLTRVERTISRDHISKQEIESRIKRQSTDDYKIERSHWVVINDGNKLILPCVSKIHQELMDMNA